MNTTAPLSSRSVQFYAITKKWASDLNFFRIETAFFHRLLEHQFIGLSFFSLSPANLNGITFKLNSLDNELQNAEKQLDLQLREIELMAEDILPEDSEWLTGGQVQLEFLMVNITRRFRDIKKEIFGMIDVLSK